VQALLRLIARDIFIVDHLADLSVNVHCFNMTVGGGIGVTVPVGVEGASKGATGVTAGTGNEERGAAPFLRSRRRKRPDEFSPRICLCVHYDQIGGAGGGNYHEIVGFHNPKDVFADYRDFDEDPHNRNQNQHDGYDKQRLETFGQAVDGEPNKISADQDPKGVVAKYRNFSKDSHDRGGSHHEREKPSKEKHLAPKVTIGQPEEQGRISPIRKRPTQQASFDLQ
jgi:hypothetical protein